MEKKTEVKVFRVDKICPECEEGVMLSAGHNNPMTNMPVLDHRCDKCGHPEKYDKVYPATEFEEVRK